LKRISAHSEKKVHLRKASILVPGQATPVVNGEQGTGEDHAVAVE
jgi:hypothetical protein